MCCNGTLFGEAFGEKFVGNNCHFMNDSGCSIYEHRPENPCKLFKCEWLRDTTYVFPESLKPDKSGFILLTKYTKEKTKYLLAVSSRKGYDQEALLWLIDWANRKNENLCINLSYKKYYLGTAEFRKQLEK